MPTIAIQNPEFEIIEVSAIDKEIFLATQEGYEVTRGATHDEAYDIPHLIDQVRTDLDKQGKEYKERSRGANKFHLAGTAIQQLADRNAVPLPTDMFRRAAKKRDAELEEIRADILFDETKMPWHLQRGRALALQSITDAHNLLTVEELWSMDRFDHNNGFQTMAGQLETLNPETFVFSEKDGALAGMNLRDAFIEAQQRLSGKTLEGATRAADKALSNLELFLNAPVTQEFKDIVAYCQDSLGIRSRMQEVRSAISAQVDTIREKEPGKKNLMLLSVGCGTAQSILEVARDALAKGLEPTIILLDQDPIALAAARHLATQMGLGEYIEIHCEKLFDNQGRPFNIAKILNGRSVDIAEDTGLREYLPEKIYKNLSGTIWNNLSENGMMTTGNMNKNRPQPEFLHGLMGWNPSVVMRTIQKGFELHEESGVPKGATRARVTRDNVYTLFFSYKSAA